MTPEELHALIDRAADEGWKELDLSGHGLTELPPAIGKLTQLETLILGKVEEWKWADKKLVPTLVTNNLTTLPNELAALENLRSLDVSGNPFTVIPDVVLELQQLISLTLVSTGLSEIPEAIAPLTNLTELDLDNNQISDIEAIAPLTNLTTLSLDNNQISDIEAIAPLTNLTELDLSNNQISDIEAIAPLTNLTELDLSNNQISDIEAIAPLINLTTLSLSNNQISDIEAIAPLTNLTALSLGNNQISNIAAITPLINLTTLSLSNNQISDIEAIAPLTNLTALSLGNNQINNIAAIAPLTNLTELYLYNNQISDIAAIAPLTNLTELYLSNNQISDIAAIAPLTNLTRLYLTNNQISDIAAIAPLTNLTELDLYNNQISDIAAIAPLTNLTQLDLSNNQISDIAAIAPLTNLSELYLYNNQISDIAAIAPLTNLTQLDLSNNQINDIAAIAPLTNLSELSLYNNQISDIAAIATLTNLSELSLNKNQISDIEAIATLTNLTRLSLNNNQISDIEAIATLTNLTELYLYNNQISDIEAIATLTNLTELYLTNNQISDIEAIAPLTNLATLYLTNNQISDIEAIAPLTNLIELYLNNNQISDIATIAPLTNLTTLYLYNNQISDIAAIANLTNLKELDFENNLITNIPEAIKQFGQLEKLDLRGNPINIPPDILAPSAGETHAEARPILDYYFRTQDPKETTDLYEAKLLIVGEGGSGKTSLARKLLDPDYKLPAETEDNSTQGIDILRWEFTGRNQQSYRVNIWDFGGQEIYHQTHQFFLTERALYLLVADSRKEDTDHYFWLHIIRLLSDDSPVLLIQNEKQNRTCNLNLSELRAEFVNLRPPLSTNLADNRGLSTVQSTVQHSLEELLPNGIPFPNGWLNVRYALENDGRNYIDFAEYQSICRYHGIHRNEEMCDLSRFLHSLGICLHFQKDPILRHRLILKPNWGTSAVYKILDNAGVRQKRGQFSNADLDTIWQSQQYAAMRYELLQLMKEFKVCYEIPRRSGNYIAPHLLSPEPPAYTLDGNPNLILRYCYKGFMPKGIFTRFIVEMHELIENVSDPDQALVWKYGVVLKKERTRAEIIEHSHDHEIRIRLSGTNQRDFLVTLNYEFEKIHKSFERLNYDTRIPCNCTLCKSKQEPYSYTLDHLKKFIDQRFPTIQCYESFEYVNVRRLLDDSIELPVDPRLQEKGDRDFERMERMEREQLLGDRFKFTIVNTLQQGDFKPMTDITNNNQGANIGNLVNQATDNAQVSAAYFNQTSGATTAELLQLIASLRQTVTQLPQEVQEDITVDIDDVEAEVKKPDSQRNPARLKKRLMALLAAASVIATHVEGINKFADTVIDLGSKVGIELQLPAAP